MLDYKICAVVVTYNRLELLKECIDSLRNQTRKLDEIIVVNNDSQDGTKEWLNEQEDITKIHQQNLGGAGGFHNGMKLAYEKGYDWIWLMDDDCLPKLDSLDELLNVMEGVNVVLNSIILSREYPNRLNFGLYDYKAKIFFDDINQISDKKYLNGAGFFNGSLFSKETVSKVGFPNPLFFIYGDETEYYLRILKLKIPIKTITSSIVFHPKQLYIYFGKGKFFYRFNYYNQNGIKYFARNLMAIWYVYDEFTFRRLVKTYFYDLGCIIIIQKNISFAFKYLLSIFKGISLSRKIKRLNLMD